MRPRSPRSTSVCASLPSVAALLAAGIAFSPAVGAQHHTPSNPRGGMRPAHPRPPTPPSATPPTTPVVQPPQHPPVNPTTPTAQRPPDHPGSVRGGEGKVSLVPIKVRD